MTGAVSCAAPVRISTAGYSERERLAVLQDHYARTVVKSVLTPLGDAPVHFEATVQGLPGLTISSIACSGLAMRRGKAAADPDRLVFTMTLAGRRHAAQRGRETTVEAGEAFLVSGDAGEAVIDAGSRYLSLTMPRSAMAPLVRDLDAHFVRPIRRDTEALRLLVDYAGILQDPHAMATPELRCLAVAHVQDLVALTLGATRDAAQIAELGGARAARLHAIKIDIADHLGGDLSVAGVAARHCVAVRYVQRLFEAEGVTFTEFVLAARLTRAHRLLGDVRLMERPIGTIALDVGFTTLSHFNHSFRRRFGLSPSDVRAQARRAADRPAGY